MLEVVPGKSRMLGARFLFLPPAPWSLLFLLLFFIISDFSSLTVSAQMGMPKGGSPLYNSRPYSPPAPSGLPKALNDVGIDQKLNEQLPLDLEFRNESGEAVKLGKYFGNKPVPCYCCCVDGNQQRLVRRLERLQTPNTGTGPIAQRPFRPPSVMSATW